MHIGYTVITNSGAFFYIEKESPDIYIGKAYVLKDREWGAGQWALEKNGIVQVLE